MIETVPIIQAKIGKISENCPLENLDFPAGACYNLAVRLLYNGGYPMIQIKTLETRNLCESAKNGGCGECQTSCQSACKTSCGIANQNCENK